MRAEEKVICFKWEKKMLVLVNIVGLNVLSQSIFKCTVIQVVHLRTGFFTCLSVFKFINLFL